MKNAIRRMLSRLLGGLVHSRCFAYDRTRFEKYSGKANPSARDALLALIAIRFHVLEKGLTMPNRRLAFGKKRVLQLIDLIGRYERLHGEPAEQVVHAIAVIREYREMHSQVFVKGNHDDSFWEALDRFLTAHADVPAARQLHFTRQAFYADRDADFVRLAHARHSVRNYAPVPVPVERIRRAVELAMTAPSACNRQPCRVHCVTDKENVAAVLELQAGCRGFAHLVDKVLLVTSDLECAPMTRERNDVFTNGGIFLMNLCYALYHEEVAHCILNWSRPPKEDLALRKIVKMKPSECVVAVLSCGEVPDEFDVAASPRKGVDSAFVLH